MTGLTISQLPEITVTDPNALLVIVTSGTTYKIPFSALTSTIFGNVDTSYIPVLSSNTEYVSSQIFQTPLNNVRVKNIAPADLGGEELFGVHAGETESFANISSTGSLDYGFGITHQNNNSGFSASTDVVIINDTGDYNEGYIDMGINSSTYTGFTGVFALGGPSDAYLFSTANDLYIGNASAGKKMVFFNGGFDTNAYAKMYIHEDGSITINTSEVDFNNPAALRIVNVNSSTSMIHADGNIDDFSEIASINTNAGEFASADIVATNDLGNTDPTQGYVNMGINSTTYTPTDNIGGPNDTYMYGTGTHMHIGNASESPFSDVYIFTNGRGDEATRISVMADGTVGFHTMTPQYPVDISGTTRVQNGDFIITSGQTNLGNVIQANNNTEAMSSGLTFGDVYRNGDFLKIVTSGTSVQGGLDGLNYTYVYGNGADALENGQQLLDGYTDAASKVIIDNPTIDYGQLEIVGRDATYWYSEPLDTSILEPYFSNGQLQLSTPLELILNGISYIATLENIGLDYVFDGFITDPNPADGIYSSTTVTEFYLYADKSTLIVGPGYYEVPVKFDLTIPYVDVVSLTGEADVFLSSTDGGDSLQISTNNIYVKGINTGTETISINGTFTNLTMENCIGLGDYSFAGETVSLPSTFINCEGGIGSFGGLGSDCTGIFINCKGGIGSFGGGSGSASGTFTNCTASYSSFGGEEASGIFENCKAEQDSFGGSVSSGTFRNCVTTYNGFAQNGKASGNFYNCDGGYNSFAGNSEGIASGNFYNCVGQYNCFGGLSASGNFYDCVGGYESFGGSVSGTASGNFYNCVGEYNCFGYDNADGYFNNCVGTDSCFGFNGSATGSFYNCVGGTGSFGSSDNAIASGVFSNCKGGNSSFGAGDNAIASGVFLNCTAGTYSFGREDASGTFTNCVARGYQSFGIANASGFFNNCTTTPSSEGLQLAFACQGVCSGTFINCTGGGTVGSDISFGGSLTGTLTGTLSFCKLLGGTFQTVSGGGITRYCLNGDNTTNNQG